ncbi:uncharacterized protein [Apostichopus japonicus]|uniref:uncharacterized protein isoform X2 n=1 Tax=Stichopus japonicus TaxID=307972 RepID=UPI003AB71901
MALLRRSALSLTHPKLHYTSVDLSAFLVQRETRNGHGKHLFIEHISPGGILHDGGIRHSDRLISVNKVPVEQFSFDLILESIRSLSVIALAVERKVNGKVIPIVAILDIGFKSASFTMYKYDPTRSPTNSQVVILVPTDQPCFCLAAKKDNDLVLWPFDETVYTGDEPIPDSASFLELVPQDGNEYNIESTVNNGWYITNDDMKAVMTTTGSLFLPSYLEHLPLDKHKSQTPHRLCIYM